MKNFRKIILIIGCLALISSGVADMVGAFSDDCTSVCSNA